jgi:hypothetical protein
VSYPISKLINKSFEFPVFPNKLKEAYVIPLHKKSNTLDKGNYRPVSILPMISKHFERSIETQWLFAKDMDVKPLFLKLSKTGSEQICSSNTYGFI